MSFRRFVARRFWDDERAREIDAHIAIETDENIARGMAPDEAKAAALRKFGNPLSIREEIYDMNSIPSLESLWQDLRHAARLLGVDVRAAGYAPSQRAALYDRILKRLRAIPGVRSASQAQNTPVVGGTWQMRTEVPGYAERSRQDRYVSYNRVSDHYFTTLGTPMLAGRDLSDRDTAESPAVAIVNEAFARRFNGSALGQSFLLPKPGGGTRPVEVIGIVKDARYRSLRDPAPPTAYLAMRQETQPRTSANFQLRSSIPPAGVISAVAEAVLSEDKSVSLGFKTFATQVSESLVQERLVAALCGFFALLAVALVLIGLHGLIAYGVARRKGEIGIRVALGADRPRVLWLVLRDVLLLTTAGTFLGLLASLALARFVDSMLYGLTPNDPLTMASAAMLLVTLGMLAGYLPARRAARLHPMDALREE